MTAIVAVLALVLTSCSGSDAQLDANEPWDLVWISDSMGAGVAQAWADRIEEAEGVDVRVHDHFQGNLSLVQARELLSDQAVLREEVAVAEIVVVYGNPLGAGIPSDAGTCVSTSTTPRDPPNVYTSADVAPYGDVLREIYDDVFELRSGQPTVIRAFDEFNGRLADWREAGIEDACTAYWEANAGALREAATDYGVAVASFYDAFNGTDHDKDPRQKGYIAPDGYHASPEGVLAQVEVLHALGYDPIIP
jgi:hypothetical protein